MLPLLTISKSVLSGCAFLKNFYTWKLGKISVLCAVIFKGITDTIDLFKVNNRSTRKRCEICSKLTIKKHQNDSGVFILCVNLL